MPSANPKLEKQASTEAVDPVRQAIIVIEHKIRNLEKRKGKLESYKDLQKGGGELNADQKTAVAKYDEVVQTLDITRDLHKQVQGIANDALKQQKKLARKEALERMQQDISKVREVLLIQDTLMNMGADSVREDFLAGVNGAVKLTEEDLKALDNLYNEMTITHRRDDSSGATIVQQAQKIAEYLVAIVEGKQREFLGISFGKFKEIITSVTQCGYFDQLQEVAVAVTEVTEAVAEVQIADPPVQEQTNEDFNAGDRHIPPSDPTIPIPNFVQITPHPVVTGAVPVSAQIPVVGQPLPPHPAAPVESYYSNAGNFVPSPQQPQVQQPQVQQQTQAPRINDVIGTPNFFFLQESEIDSPDVNTQTPIVSHIPPTVNAPIPTQTFTNQSFTSAPVVPQPVMYQHQPPPPDMSHIPGFANPNPPPPIPMPPSHQPNMQYSPQHPAGYQQQPPGLSQITQPQQQVYDHRQPETQNQPPEEKNNQNQVEQATREGELEQQNEPLDWGQMSENPGDWNQPDPSQDSSQDQHQSSQQAWGDQQQRSSGYRGRGGRRGNSNGYNGRGRGGGGSGTGGYQQNGRSSTGGGQGSYYRNENSNYQQNGYHQRNWNEGNGGYSSGFKRGSGGARGGARGERGTENRGGRGQFRGSQRGSSRGGYSNRGKPQVQQ